MMDNAIGYRHGSRGCWSSTDKWSTGHLCCKLRDSIHNPLSATMMLSVYRYHTNQHATSNTILIGHSLIQETSECSRTDGPPIQLAFTDLYQLRNDIVTLLVPSLCRPTLQTLINPRTETLSSVQSWAWPSRSFQMATLSKTCGMCPDVLLSHLGNPVTYWQPSHLSEHVFINTGTT